MAIEKNFNVESLTEKQLADFFNCTPAMLKKQRADGTGVPYFKVGTLVRYLKSDVVAYIEANMRSKILEKDRFGRGKKRKGKKAA
jgi:hypothetical protein